MGKYKVDTMSFEFIEVIIQDEELYMIIGPDESSLEPENIADGREISPSNNLMADGNHLNKRK